MRLLLHLPLMLLVCVSTFGELLKAPPSVGKEKGSLVATDKGKVRWTADWTMEPVTIDGVAAIRFTEKGRGLYSWFQTPVQWMMESVWRAEGDFHPISSERTFMDSDGKTLAVRTKAFDDSRGIVLVDGKPITVPLDTITVDGIGGVLRSLPFDSGRPFSTHFLTNEPGLYEVSIEPRGRETVRTAAGEFECYKVEIVPHLGVLRIFTPFMSRTYFWFTVAAPHFWVKYEGFENGPKSPQIVLELKSHEK